VRCCRVEAAAVILEGYIKAYHIPPDLDDSSVNMALGGMLAAQRDKFPQAYAKWEAVNSNVTGLFELINKVPTLRRTTNSPRARTHSRERWLSHRIGSMRIGPSCRMDSSRT
jgi:hypothetical protein